MRDGRVFVPRDLMALAAVQAQRAGVSVTRWIIETIEIRLGVPGKPDQGAWGPRNPQVRAPRRD